MMPVMSSSLLGPGFRNRPLHKDRVIRDTERRTASNKQQAASGPWAATLNEDAIIHVDVG